jgi:hypothetical protein
MGVLVRALWWAGAAALGYFANDIGDGVTRYVPAAESKTTGKIAWYWMVLILLVIAASFIWVVQLVIPKKYQK